MLKVIRASFIPRLEHRRGSTKFMNLCDDGTYYYDNWKSQQFSKWRIEDDIVYVKHNGDMWPDASNANRWLDLSDEQSKEIISKLRQFDDEFIEWELLRC